MEENAYSLGLQVATLIEQMKHVREGITDIKKALDKDLPALDERVRRLEMAQLVWKTRVATGTTIGTALGGLAAFILEKIW